MSRIWEQLERSSFFKKKIKAEGFPQEEKTNESL
jgi:hypothetical protein